MSNEELKELSAEELEEVAGGLSIGDNLSLLLSEVRGLGLPKEESRSAFASLLANNFPIGLLGEKGSSLAGGLVDKLRDIALGKDLADSAVAGGSIATLANKLLAYFDENWDI